jgi:hypothetical protein
MPSFLDVNYSLRLAKNVERKLMVECLRGIQRRFDLASYRYVGMGSMWFTDFILFHKAFGLREMFSIENKEDYVPRAKYNAPFSCIRVEKGDTTHVLPDLRLDDGPPSLIWLDYDQDLTSAPIFADLPILCESLPSGSVVMITLNAHPNQLSKLAPGGVQIPRTEVLASYLDLSETEIPPEGSTKNGFAPFLSQALFDRIESLTIRNSGGLHQFYPIFNYWYRDNAPMITVGGMIANDVDAALLAACDLPTNVEFARGREQLVISIPNLTTREKFALDRTLPCDVAPNASAVDTEFPLSAEEISGYHQFYRFYPLFGELVS